MVFFLTFVLLLSATISALPYDPEQEPWNLNTNQAATDPLQYDGVWENHKYQPSPDNWRFPVYTIFLDRFANGEF
jgi:alpha-1,3-glucan synthase